jgi:hypothetical protein
MSFFPWWPRRVRTILVFIGHDYFGSNSQNQRKLDYRNAIVEACEEINQYLQIQRRGLQFSVIYGENPEDNAEFMRRLKRRKLALNADFWRTIRLTIELSDYALFDVSYRNPAAHRLNTNVVLEYGVALGLGKNPRVFCNEASRPLLRTHLSDLASQLYHVYDDQYSNQFKDAVKRQLIAFLSLQPH